MIKGGEPDDLLTDYANKRREAWLEITSPSFDVDFKVGSAPRTDDAVKFPQMIFGSVKSNPDFQDTS